MVKMEELIKSEVYTLLQCTRGRIEDIDKYLDNQIIKGKDDTEEFEYWSNQKKDFIDLSIKLDRMTYQCED
jgi:hypothetical protein